MKKSMKKSLGLATTIELLLLVAYVVIRNFTDPAIVKICFVVLLVLIQGLFLIKLGTGFAEGLKKPPGDKSG